jgi:nucleoside-diphosphate-sugar epimerase
MLSHSSVLVTGAGGYIGGAIARELAAAGFSVQGGVRRDRELPVGVRPLVTGDLAQTALDLSGLDAVVHAAGLGHRRGVAPEVWRSANVDAAVNMARLAKAGGAKRFVLISTAHVHGRVHEGIVSDDTPPNPMDDYAASKLEAERAVAAMFGHGLSILRPVAVIGPHCPGNLQLVMKLLRRGLPLPFGAIANRRSFVDVADLARLTQAVLQAPEPPGIVLAASPDAISTPELIEALAEGMGVAPKLLAFPPAVLAAAAKMLGRAAMWQSLAGSFVANPQAALRSGWQPANNLRESLVKTGKACVVS